MSFVLDAVAGQLFFFAWGGDGGSLWKSDGTGAGTAQVYDFGWQPQPTLTVVSTDRVAVGGRLYFRAWDANQEIDLWASDGTTASTALVAETASPTSSIRVSPSTGRVADPTAWGALGQKLIHPADDGTSGSEPWMTDGTAAGTQLLGEIEEGPFGSSYSGLTPLGNGKALFTYGNLWETDGTPAGTTPLVFFPEDTPLASHLIRAVFFGANDGTTGFELWAFPQSALTTPLDFYSVAPCRVADTRGGDPLRPGPAAQHPGDGELRHPGRCEVGGGQPHRRRTQWPRLPGGLAHRQRTARDRQRHLQPGSSPQQQRHLRAGDRRAD